MIDAFHTIDARLLEDFQRDFPLVPRPFAAIGDQLGVSEAVVMDRLAGLMETGRIARVGATCCPNTVGASTLAALQIPLRDIERTAELIAAEPGINHAYLREHEWNLWFVATAPDRRALASSLRRIEARTGFTLLELPLVRSFNIDLGFRLSGPREALPEREPADIRVLRPDDAPLMQALASGLDLVPRPFERLAKALGRGEEEIRMRIGELVNARLLTRTGIIVRHRALGWRSNAMVVWQVPVERIRAAGSALARVPGVTLCYQRRTVPGVWPYSLFCMVHARSRREAISVITEAEALPELRGIRYDILFSVRCFKQTGALVHQKESTG